MPAFGAITRQKEITDRLRSDGRVSVAGLAHALGVSVVTIRNDLDLLERAQVLRRLRGGAIAVRPARFERSSHPLDTAFEAEKQRIGELAASMVRDGETIIIDAGSTTMALARALPQFLHDVAVVTPALDVALELERHAGIKVIVTGGTVAKPQRCLVPPFATTLLRQINADVAFVACSGVDARKGFTTQSWEEAEVKHAIVAAASRIVVLADHGKIGHVATAKIMDLGEAELLVTDTGASGGGAPGTSAGRAERDHGVNATAARPAFENLALKPVPQAVSSWWRSACIVACMDTRSSELGQPITLSRRRLARTGFAAATIAGLARPARAQSGPVVVASDEDVTTLDPHLIRNNHPVGSIVWSVFDSLVRRRPDGTHAPRLALSWSQPSPAVWRFALRPGVVFHNGEPFDAQAVVESFERMNRTPFNGESQLWQQTRLVSVAAPSPSAVELTTDGPCVTMLYWLEEAFVGAPRHLRETPADQVGLHPVGSGPYRFVEWQQGDHVTLTANDAYWGGAPPIRELVFRTVPEQSSRLFELRAGSVDLVPGLNPDSAAGAASALSKTVRVPGLRKMHLGFSQNGIAPLRDAGVRRALNHAVDVATMIETLQRGLGTQLASVVNPPNADPALVPYRYDPAKAASLLHQAGYEKFAVEIAFDAKYPDSQESCETVAAYLADAGLLADVVAYESGHFAETLRARAFPGLYFYGFGALIEPLVELVIFTSDAVDNAGGYNNPDFDRLMRSAAATTDDAARRALLRQAERMVWEDAPWLFLWHLPEINGISNRLHYQPRPDEYVELYEARVAA